MRCRVARYKAGSASVTAPSYSISFVRFNVQDARGGIYLSHCAVIGLEAPAKEKCFMLIALQLAKTSPNPMASVNRRCMH